MTSLKVRHGQPRRLSFVKVVAFEEEEEEEYNDGYISSCGISNIKTGEDSAGIFSDDTGFSSQEEVVGDTETEEDDEEQETLKEQNVLEENAASEKMNRNETFTATATAEELRSYEVEKNYAHLVQKYTNKGFVDSVKDPFDQQVDYCEIRMVLQLSISPQHWKNFVIPALLLDTITRLWAKQVVHAHKETNQVAEMLAYRNKKKQLGRSKQMDTSSTACADPSAFADEGYGSQPSSQQSQDQQEQLEMMDDGGDGGRALERICKRSKKFIAGSIDQFTSDFVKELSATVVSRRRFLHERCRQMVQDPYLDHQFDMQEYYDDFEVLEKLMVNESGRLGQNARDLLEEMKKFTRAREMSGLKFPALKYFLNEDDSGDEVEEPCVREIGNEEPMDVDISSNDFNNENIQPLLLALANVSPQEEQQENSLVIPAVPEAEMGDGENIPPPKTKEKKKKKKRRMPLLEKQIINAVLGEEWSGDLEAKRPRLEIEGTVGGFEQDCEQLQHQQNMETSLLGDGGGLSLVVNAGAQNDCSPTETDFGNGVVDIYESCSDLNSADGDDCSFRPPSLLFQTKDSSLPINLQASSSRVDMSAIKSKFNNIIQESFHHNEHHHNPPLTFVQILQKSEMDIIVSPNETISPPNRNPDDDSDYSSSSSTNECSVGVAFLAMLHNASLGNFYLVEDKEGAFKVTKDKPADGLNGIV